jgi:hypothetical protein
MATSSDSYALAALRRRDIRVDRRTGAVLDRHGRRAERPTRGGAGRVLVNRKPKVWAPAHRVVWLAVHGAIPHRAVIRHHNGRAWDNCPANLYVTGQRGFVRYDIAPGDIAPGDPEPSVGSASLRP